MDLDQFSNYLTLSNGPPPGRLVDCADARYQGKVFYAANGRRRWLCSAAHVNAYEFRWPDSVERVSSEEMASYALSSPLALPWTPASCQSPPRVVPGLMREIATAQLCGTGIEFGAFSNPFPTPLNCTTLYADAFSQGELQQRLYPGQTEDIVSLSYVTTLEEMAGLPEMSMDFIIAAHVIEHTRNPLRVLENAYRRLKPGGRFVLVVPDIRLTFDRQRDVTELDHLILDYEDPREERDYLHFFEFFTKAFVTPIESVYARALQAIKDRYDIHFHTWTYESFGCMIEYARGRLSPWVDVWSHPAVEEHQGANEFYYVLKR